MPSSARGDEWRVDASARGGAASPQTDEAAARGKRGAYPAVRGARVFRDGAWRAATIADSRGGERRGGMRGGRAAASRQSVGNATRLYKPAQV